MQLGELHPAACDEEVAGIAGRQPGLARHMIIITGSVTASPDSVEEIETLSLAHVRRSRLEPGCLAHGVSRDVENPNRFVFFEQWLDQPAVDTHFAVPESGEFVTSLMKLADPDSTSTLEMFETK